ncbi:MAG TPA: hypothetical protein PKJ44_05995, partial [Thauera aminoaromatica]|nr:hypothetical protein [Thauera aminoaromatica]
MGDGRALPLRRDTIGDGRRCVRAEELLERIERFVQALLGGDVPAELQDALPQGLTEIQKQQLVAAAHAFDEITCTTIHGFCQQLIKPYPI